MNPDDAIPALCEHIRPLAEHLVSLGAKATYAGTPWSRNCRTWVYFDRVIDCEALLAQFKPPACVTLHDHRGTHDGSERGLQCGEHHDAVMGRHPQL
jgi:hypothetical protein